MAKCKQASDLLYKIFFSTIIALLGTIGISFSAESNVSAQSVPQATYGRAVQGSLSENAPIQEWRFEARPNDVLSILVNRDENSTLDPKVAVIDANGQVIAENDDRIPTVVLDAGIEGLTFPQAASYTIRVSRQRGDGNYQMWLLPAPYIRIRELTDFSGNLSRWTARFVQPANERLRISSDPTFAVPALPEGSLPLQDFYLQAEFEWLSDRSDVEATIGFALRTIEDDTRRPAGYYFFVTPDGKWSFNIRQNETFTPLQPPTPSGLLSSPRVVLGIWFNGDVLRFYAEGELLGEIRDSTFESGGWSIQVRGETSQAVVGVDNLLITVPNAPPFNVPLTIGAWDSIYSGDIVDELVAKGILEQRGERILNILTLDYGVPRQQQSIFLQGIDRETYTDFILGADIRFTEGDNVGCGLVMRYLDPANQTLAYVDILGGVGLVHVTEGIIRSNSYDLLDSVAAAIVQDETISLIIIAKDDYVVLYINGVWFETSEVTPNVGRIGVSLLNYSTTSGSCSFSNLWVWR